MTFACGTHIDLVRVCVCMHVSGTCAFRNVSPKDYGYNLWNPSFDVFGRASANQCSYVDWTFATHSYFLSITILPHKDIRMRVRMPP